MPKVVSLGKSGNRERFAMLFQCRHALKKVKYVLVSIEEIPIYGP